MGIDTSARYQWRHLVLRVAHLLRRLHLRCIPLTLPPQIRPLPLRALRPRPLHPLRPHPQHPHPLHLYPLYHLCLPRSTRQAVTLRRHRLVVNGRDEITMTTDPRRKSSMRQKPRTSSTFPAFGPLLTDCRANTPAQVITQSVCVMCGRGRVVAWKRTAKERARPWYRSTDRWRERSREQKTRPILIDCFSAIPRWSRRNHRHQTTARRKARRGAGDLQKRQRH